MTAFSIEERRKRTHAPRTFERRKAGKDDARVIQHLENLGPAKVQSELKRGGFNGRHAVATRWLDEKSNATKRKIMLYTVAPGLGLGLVVIAGWLVF